MAEPPSSSSDTTNVPNEKTTISPPPFDSEDSKAAENDEELPPNRFELELEFVQCLASPAYLHHLATTGMFSDNQFLAFLNYLKYWKRPEYVRLLTYPHALHFLDLLTGNERFRREMANVGFRNFVHEQQFYAWQFRSRELYGTGLPQDGALNLGQNTDSENPVSNENLNQTGDMKDNIPQQKNTSS